MVDTLSSNLLSPTSSSAVSSDTSVPLRKQKNSVNLELVKAYPAKGRSHLFRQPHVDGGGRFRNDPDEGSPFWHLGKAALIGTVTMLNRAKNFVWGRNLDNASSENVTRVLPLVRDDGLSAQWIGHASVLIQVGGHNILTDPIFGDLGKIGPEWMNLALYPRRSKVGINPDMLPPIDFILISHTHRDHLDESSLRFLCESEKHQHVKILAPDGSTSTLESMGIESTRVSTYSWWQDCSVSVPGKDNLTFTFTPARHWSGRGLTDVNQQLWGGWMIENNDKNTRTYFSGDSALDQKMFEEIRRYFSPQKKGEKVEKTLEQEFETESVLDLLLLAIGPCAPRCLMEEAHMDAHEALKVTHILKARHVVPIHHLTYELGIDEKDAPIKAFTEAWNESSQAQQHESSQVQTGFTSAFHDLQPSERIDAITAKVARISRT